MYIKEINIRKYRHVEDIQLGPFLPPGDASDMIVFAGPNGSGKSSVLELISKALANSWSLTYTLNRSAPESSFEVCVGLLASEIELIKEKFNTDNSLKDVIEYLTINKSYYRSFEFNDGEYSKNPTLQNKIHNCVIKALKGDYFRPLGFHLGSERSFKKTQYDYRNKFFNLQTYMQKQHTWGFAFRTESEQFEDMFDFLIAWHHNFLVELGAYHRDPDHRNSGSLEPVDHYGKILSRVFPEYRFVHKPENAPTDLFVETPSGHVIPFSDLSSGEKQVFFTLCFFERHDVEEAVIVIDEPELHLHPSLARLLLRSMQSLKPRNQIWIATQSSDVIDEAGRDRVWFIRRNDTSRKAELIRATDEEPALECLRDFFGYSGYIGLAKAMIFTEGRNASTDRKMFSRLFPQYSREIKFVPANGSSEIERINQAVLQIIEGNIGWCRFCLIRDRDYMTPDVVQGMEGRTHGRLHILKCHEIENYLLNVDVISRVLRDLFDQALSPDEVEKRLQQAAVEMSADVLRDMVTYRLNLIFRPEDFSVPSLFRGETIYNAKDKKWVTAKVDELKTALQSRTDEAVSGLKLRLQSHNFEQIFIECQNEVENALMSDGWKSVFPGKQLLQKFAKICNLGKTPVLENAIIKEMSAHPTEIPEELKQIINEIVRSD